MVSIEIFGEIMLGRISPLLRAVLYGDTPVKVLIDSQGGNFDEAMAVFDLLKAHRGKKLVQVVRAASGAALISAAGDSIEIAAGGQMMIHQPASKLLVWSTAKDMRQAARHLDANTTEIARIHAARTGLKVSQVRELMRAGETMHAARAISLGFADTLSKTLPEPMAGPSAVNVSWLAD